MKKVFILTITIIFLGCKNDSKKTNENSKEELIEVDNNKSDVLKNIDLSDGKYRIIFEGVFEEDDLILIYYTTELGEKLTTEKSKRQKIVGSPDIQQIVLTFEKDVKPYNLRIDFSDNKLQKKIDFKLIRFIDEYNSVIINSENIRVFFNFSNQTIFNKEEGFLKGKIFQLNNKDAYNPYITSNSKFNKILKRFNEASKNNKKTSLIDDRANLNLEDGNQRVILNGIFESDDLVLLYYTEDTIESFDIKKSIRKNIIGSPNEQEIIFTIPNNIYAYKLNIDISNVKTQKKIDINTLTILTDKTKIEINKQNFHEYFYPNNYIDYNKDRGTFICKIINEGGVDKYNPYFVSTPKLIEELIYF